MIRFERTFHTDGSGLWSRHAGPVNTTELQMSRFSNNSGELRVYFDKTTWSIRKHGLIYTDEQFLRELKAEFEKLNVNASRLDYSEQGMQGDNYVSFDVNKTFMKDFEALINVTI